MITEESLKAKARELLDVYCVDNVSEFEIEEIANAEGLIIQEEKMSNHQGRINHKGDYGIITLNKAVTNINLRRIIIAHEMGHYYSMRKFKRCNTADLHSYRSDQNDEYISNIFANEFLMPEEWFLKFTKKENPSIQMLKDIANNFQVTISAACYRYSSLGDYPVTIIMSKGGKVIWNTISKAFPYQFVRIGSKVNSNSNAYNYFQGKPIEIGEHEVMAESWFSEDFNFRRGIFFTEENFVMSNLGMVLTIIKENRRVFK